MHLHQHISLRSGSATSAGRKAKNEDAFRLQHPDGEIETTKGVVAIVADGVSSAEAAAQASRICCDSFVNEYYKTPETWTTATSGQKVIATLNRYLYRRGRQYPEAAKGFVCTMSTVILKSQQVHIMHVGDSRVYRFRDGELSRLTRDHTLAINDRETYLSRAMGLDVKLQIDYKSESMREGDRYLLTTDGVHGSLTDDEIKGLLHEVDSDLQLGCDRLLEASFQAGSKDNLTAMLIEIEGLPDETADDVKRRLTQLPFAPDLSPGHILDGYRIEKEIHASSRSQVYLVRDVETEVLGIMKTPSANYADDSAYIERFIMEPWIGSRIQSPFVMKIMPVVRPRSCLYYVAEYVEGCTLAQWMEMHPHPTLEEIVGFAEQLILGLRAFQRKETLHQDLKPDNIMVDAEGKIRIVDFGSCYVAGVDEINAPIHRDLILGTVVYAAPEYHLGIRGGVQSDLFSLATIIYEMATGALPYGNRLQKAKNEKDFAELMYISATKRNPDIPLWFDGALQRALSIRIEKRYPVLSEFMEDLRTPNKIYLREYRKPLLEQNPVLFWKSTSIFLGFLCVYLFYLLVKPTV